jgi:hypothetical protein
MIAPATPTRIIGLFWTIASSHPIIPTFVVMAGWESTGGFAVATGAGTTIPPPCVSDVGLPGSEVL